MSSEATSRCLGGDSAVPCHELAGAHRVRGNLLDSFVMAGTLA